MPKDINLFKNHQLPLARIKKIMKSDEDVRVLNIFKEDDILINPSSFREGMRSLYSITNLSRLGLHFGFKKKNLTSINFINIEK